MSKKVKGAMLDHAVASPRYLSYIRKCTLSKTDRSQHVLSLGESHSSAPDTSIPLHSSVGNGHNPYIPARAFGKSTTFLSVKTKKSGS